MKVEWLNADYTEAWVTVGWFRKRRALVYRNSARDWRFRAEVGRNIDTLSSGFAERLEQRRTKDLFSSVWGPVAKLPQAKALK